MSKKIILDYGKSKEIASVMKCTKEMVSKSINFKKNSTLARKIRHVAVSEYGGKIFEW